MVLQTPAIRLRVLLRVDDMDRLTGLADRAQSIRHIEQCCRAMVPQPHWLLWLGLDRFRQINAGFGHGAADNVLAEIAHRLRGRVPEGGMLGRVGGDEFVLVMPLGTRGEAIAWAQTLIDVVHQPLEIGELRLRPSASVGVACLGDGEGSAAEALRDADQAMQHAKQLGGLQWVCAGELPEPGHMGGRLESDELLVEAQLHEALEEGGLSLSYQPIVRCSGGLEALESLMRASVHGVAIGPARFIPVAEKSGLIVRLGEWGMMTAARRIARLAGQGWRVKVAVNISHVQLTAPRFAQCVHGVLMSTGIDPACLEIELTESLFMDTTSVVQRNLDMLVEAGFPLAIDDFGTGYSCLAYLKDLPAGKLKLDCAFVAHLPSDRRALAVVRTIVALAHDLDMIVVAEGVETQAQYDCLEEAGVDAVQGYLLARPLVDADLDDWLSTHVVCRSGASL